MQNVYPIFVFKEETGYSIKFPSLKYLVLYAETLEGVHLMAKEFLEYYLEDDKNVIDKPNLSDYETLEKIKKNLGPDYVENLEFILLLKGV